MNKYIVRLLGNVSFQAFRLMVKARDGINDFEHDIQLGATLGIQ
jgi:hypothetical protein